MKLTLIELDDNDRRSYAGASETAKIATLTLTGGFEFTLVADTGEYPVFEVNILDEEGNARVYSTGSLDFDKFSSDFEKAENKLFPIIELLENYEFTLVGY